MGSNSGIAARPTFVCLRHQIPLLTKRFHSAEAAVVLTEMERYVFKIKGPGGLESGKWIKMFLSTEEVSSLTMELLLCRIQERFPGLRENAFSAKYFDGKDWIELAADDLDSFIDILETAQQEREILKRIALEVNKIAFTPPGVDTAKIANTPTGKEFDDVSKREWAGQRCWNLFRTSVAKETIV